MSGILLAKIKLFLREPWTFVIMTIMSIGFAFILGNSSPDAIKIPVYAADEMIEESIVGDILNESVGYKFNWVTRGEMEEQVTNGKAELGLELKANDFRLLVGVESQNVEFIKRAVMNAYTKKKQVEQLHDALGGEDNSALKSALDDPVFALQKNNFRGTDAVVYDNTLHSLFGFTLFFVIYTIAYNVFYILVEKQEGIWDRIILSPVRKWEMYVANFMYSFVAGYLQILIIFLVFKYWIGVDFHGNFGKSLLVLLPYVFTIVALSVLITGIAKTVQQFNAIIPIIAISFAMIGGAYWPLDIVESKFMLALSNVVPITYGMEILNGVTVYGYSMEELFYPISILLLMGVAMTGIGIHLMEKRHV